MRGKDAPLDHGDMEQGRGKDGRPVSHETTGAPMVDSCLIRIRSRGLDQTTTVWRCCLKLPKLNKKKVLAIVSAVATVVIPGIFPAQAKALIDILGTVFGN